ncbi:hypothetical protein [Paraburkholderia sp. J8-2]|uniref:hypothetical protein n=1 Tax=Paraburkholderia sp. J8-2 TaxID=2805440 RepID=UPI002AB60FD6|nr:hypothetical protein [Paraburkholderia sp. J8-2]
MDLCAGDLLQAMEHGRVYQAVELAKSLGSSTVQVDELLCALVEDGLVRVISVSAHRIVFERSRTV